jgi:ABC-type multidrug transport system ATPase subunit
MLDLEEIQYKIVNSGKNSLSFGQQKRVNIGMEIVTFPNILLLDEPTTGIAFFFVCIENLFFNTIPPI